MDKIFSVLAGGVTTEQQAPIKQEKKVGYLGSMRLKGNMFLFAINTETREVEKATYRKNLQTNRKELHRQAGFVYIPAINKKNALKKYDKK